jgi:hypothetical protein
MANSKRFSLSKKTPLEIFRSNVSIKHMIVDMDNGKLTKEQQSQMEKLANINKKTK